MNGREEIEIDLQLPGVCQNAMNGRGVTNLGTVNWL